MFHPHTSSTATSRLCINHKTHFEGLADFLDIILIVASIQVQEQRHLQREVRMKELCKTAVHSVLFVK